MGAAPADQMTGWLCRAGGHRWRMAAALIRCAARCRAGTKVRRAAQRIDAEYRKSTPWWGRCDLGDAHIFRAADRPVQIDVFCMAGTDLCRAILEDVTEVHRLILRERMRYARDIPYIARETSTAEILALRKAWARAAG